MFYPISLVRKLAMGQLGDLFALLATDAPKRLRS